MKRKTLAYLGALFLLVQFAGPLHAQDPEADSLLALANDLYSQVLTLFGERLWQEAIPLANQVLEIREARLGSEHPDVALILNDLGVLYGNSTRYQEAITVYQRALQIREGETDLDQMEIAMTSVNLAMSYEALGRYEEAERYLLRARTIREAELGPEHGDLAPILGTLGMVYNRLARFREAEPLYLKAVELYQVTLGANHIVVANAINNLAIFYSEQAKYEEAEESYQRAIEIYRIIDGGRGPDLASTLNNLALLYGQLGTFEKADSLYQEALVLYEEAYGLSHQNVALTLSNLSVLYVNQGRYAEAELLVRRSLEIFEITTPPDHPNVFYAMNNMAVIYAAQGRLAEAIALHQELLERKEEKFGLHHPEVALALNNLGESYRSAGDLSETEQYFLRSLDIIEESLGPNHPSMALSLNNLGLVYTGLGRLAASDSVHQRALAIKTANYGANHPDVALSAQHLALSAAAQGRYADSRMRLDEVIRIMDNTSGNPELRIGAYAQRGNVFRLLGDFTSALSDLEVALDALESLRPNMGGDDQVRAGFMAGYDSYFDLMVSWQLEAGEPELALDWLERGRARVLLEQLAEAQVDLRSSIPAAALAPLEARETDARSRQATYRARITSLGSRSDLSTAERDERVAVLEDSLELADADYRRVYQDIKSASPLWQDLLTSGGEPVGLAEMQSELVPDDGLLLIYEIGENSSHVFVIPPEGEQLEVVSLDVTSESLDELVPRGAIRAADGSSGLAMLRGALFPDGLWDRVQGAEEVIVIPDGALHRLPFEALVVSGDGEDARYWLDDGPPVRYAASATALYNVERRSASAGSGVLSVSDPTFDLGDILRGERDREPVIKNRADAVRAGFERAGGSLDRLPYTAEETEAIRAAFGSAEVVALQELDATEQNVREAVGDRHRYLHLATHGLVDERRGSMYASLALTPVSGTDPEPDNDGFLELHEVYGLDLTSVALAVLSACETNVGESYAGEGVFALSRGFLAAGAQRVVATQWQVDDRATAVLIGHFFEVIAEAERAGGTVDYARALRDAKLRVRNDPDNPRWSDPYYWAAFTITGQR